MTVARRRVRARTASTYLKTACSPANQLPARRGEAEQLDIHKRERGLLYLHRHGHCNTRWISLLAGTNCRMLLRRFFKHYARRAAQGEFSRDTRESFSLSQVLTISPSLDSRREELLFFPTARARVILLVPRVFLFFLRCFPPPASILYV